MNNAEQYLQMAARWSQSSKESAITLNNLGTLSYIKLGQSLKEDSDIADFKSITNRDLLYFCRKCITHRPILTAPRLNLLNDAINYWEEAIEESTTDRDDVATNSPQQVPRDMNRNHICTCYMNLTF